MAATKQEINFTRLLNRCEVMLADQNNNDWRITKYASALQQQLIDLKRSQSKPPPDTLAEYCRKVEVLKGLVEAKQMPTVSEKILVTDRIPSVTSTNTHTKELQISAKSKYRKEQKEELFESKGILHLIIISWNNNMGYYTEAALATVCVNKQEENDIDTILQHHHQIQEKLADELLNLTRNLKDNIKVSSKIVVEDTKKIQDSTKLSDVNYFKLKVESDKLESHTKACSWWIWIMLVMVMVTFLWMIMFMKMFPKK
ncbi:hypothetical protein LOTGIDRAFT_102889 [Lottia gigantea]|uniref:Vesicle transport protein USE1 n=1 Tax=Lottia gigantea TaxID=225164 RepID=V4BC98_LOTGI|nr:hypothetical protein LOTGIDRAFT_102889 [Lottia gigantea]ESP05296.1 hypothetical protein LOTGIDRAFT_102889 [Lottia gigantea]